MWNKRRTGFIGVALGPRCLKAAQVEWSSRGLRLLASAVWHEPESARPNGAAAATAATRPGPQLRTLLEAVEGFRGSTIACAPPIGLTDLHAMAAPPGSVSERRAMIANQLGTILARQSSSPRQFDYWDALRPASAPPEQTDVNVVSLPRPYVDELLAGLDEARLRCEVLDGRPFVLARALRMVGGSYAHQPVAALEWDHSGTTFCVAVGGNPLFARELRNCGFERLTKPVAAALGLSEEETGRVLASYGLPDGEPVEDHQREVQEVVGEACAGALGETVREIQKTLDYVRMQFAAIQPQRLCLLGDAAAVANLPELLQHRLNLPVDIWRPAGWVDGQQTESVARGTEDLAQAAHVAREDCAPGEGSPPAPRPACLAAAISLSALARES